MQIISPVFTHDTAIPKEYTADGANLSPPLQWSGTPAEAKSLALICDDPDAPRGTWVHWVVYNLPATQMELKEGVPPKGKFSSGGLQGKNDFGKLGYGGPSPPPGKPHHYYCKLYALDRQLDLPEGATKAEVEQAMDGHVLASAQIMGRYGR